MNDVSVIIVNWNTKDLLLKCIQSIHDTTREIDYEIIVVDNGSNDGSQDALNDRFPEVKLIENRRNLGFARANNIGIQASQARYECLVNSDVLVLDGCLDAMLAYMDSHPSIGVLGPKLLNSDMSLQPSCKQMPTIWNNLCVALGLHRLFKNIKFFNGEHLSYLDHNQIKHVQALAGAFLMVRKSAIEKAGLLDDAFFVYGEEIDWCLRFRKKRYEIVFFPKARAIHFGAGSSSKERNRFYRELYVSKLKFYKKHFSKSYSNAIILVHILRQNIRILKCLLYKTLLRTGESEYSAELAMHKDVANLLWGNLRSDA